MNDLGRHMALIEQAIAGAFVNDGLHVHLLGGTQGPHTLTYALRLYQPTKANIYKALRLSSAVEAAISDSPVRIYTERGIIFVEVPSPVPVTIYGRTLRGRGLAVPMGMTSRRAIAGVDFEKQPHLLLVAPTGKGKTVAARNVAYHLAKQNPARHVRFIVAAFKAKDWHAFANLHHTFAVIQPDEVVAMLDWVHGIMLKRTKTGTDTPHLFVFLDDLLNLISATGKAIVDRLADIASLGRGAGIHLIVGTQRLGKRGAGDAAVTGNMDTRLVLGSADAQDGAYFAGRGETGVEKLGRYPGDALLVSDGGTQRLAVAYVADADLATLPQNPDTWRPWIRTAEPVTRQGGSIRAENHPNTLMQEPVRTQGVSGPTAVLTGEPVTLQEIELVRQVYARTGSKNQTCKEIWGFKNGDTWRWLHKALEA
jgi:DNA polymerase III delta prime subunit